MNEGVEGLDGYLIYDQTALDSKIDSALNEEIASAILEAYYREAPLTLGIDSDYYGSLEMNCVHQQTHKGSSREASQIIVYANVVCKATSRRYSLTERVEQLNGIVPLPIRVELQEQDDSFSVIDYQFPRKGSDYKRDMKKIFSPSAIEDFSSSEIRDATYNHLALKRM